MGTDEIPIVYYGQADSKGKLNAFWWNSDEVSLPSDVFGVVNRIKNDQSYRRTDLVRHARLYSNTDFDKYVSGVTAGLFGKKLSFNISKACVDTATAKIAQSKTRPLFLTTQGSKKQQNRAKKLTQYIDGCFDKGRVYESGKQCFRDACVFGTGVMKILEVDGQVAYERVFVHEIIVDELDGRMGKPRQLHQCRLVHREILKEMFSDNEKNLDAIERANDFQKPSRRGVSEMIEVVESWHLRSSTEATDGKHTICIGEKALLVEKWEHDFYPFAFVRWSKPLLGFYGEGLVAELIGIQLEINLLLTRIKEAQELMAVPRIFLEEGSSVNSAHITDEVGGIIKYRGTKPEALTWQAMNPEIYNYLEYLFKKGFEVTGISQLSASSKKPAGLDSGVAIREYQDIETERFSTPAEAYQQFYLDIAEITIPIQRELCEENSKLSINVKGKKFIETIKWKEVDLDDDKFIMQAYPTNFLPKTPEGKLAFVQELIQSGFIDPDWALSLLDYPDLEYFLNLKTAAIDDIGTIIEKMVEDEEYTPPEEYTNLQLAIQMAQSAYLRAKIDGTSETSKELLLRFIDDCQEILKKMTPPLQPGVPTGPLPGAVAKADKPPRSDLVPFNGALPQ